MATNGKPLLTPAEISAHQGALKKLKARYDRKELEYQDYYAQRDALENAHLALTVKKAQARADEYLDGLLVLVGTRGVKYVEFYEAFETSGSEIYRYRLKTLDTPENRRALYTILRALIEVPKSWAMSAIGRFLRGNGKQKGAKYHGAGTLGTAYGWTGRDVGYVLGVIADRRNMYAQVLMTYEDMYDKLSRNTEETELVPYDTRFKAVNVERDTEFLKKLCDLLEARGLAPVPTAAAEKPKKERKVKVFKSGDIVRKGTLRDLQFPAHLRMPIEKHHEASGQWLADTFEVVALKLTGPYATVYYVKDGVAYPSERYQSEESKSWLIGCTYLGEWKGKVDKTKKSKVNFRFRHKEN